MKCNLFVSVMAGMLFSNPVWSQEYRPITEVDVNVMASAVQECFRESTTENQVRDCLDYLSDVIESDVIHVVDSIDLERLFGDPAERGNDTRFDRSRVAFVSYPQIFQVLDRVLNVEYQLTLPDPDWADSKEEEARTRNAQRAWVQFRDAECISRHGSPENAYRYYETEMDICRSDLTKTRIMELILKRHGAYGFIGAYDPENFSYGYIP